MIVKQFDRLYTLDSKKKIRVFDCRVETGLVLGCYTVTTSTGLLSGKLTEHNDLIKIGKQNRTTEQQAVFIANSLWEDKFDEGYKSEEQLVTTLTSKGIDPLVGIVGTTSQASHHLPNWYVTNKNWDELPMLAKKFKDIKSPNYPYFAQPKLNGVRCLAKFVEERGDGKVTQYIKLCSRGGQYYQIEHIQQVLHDLFFELKEYKGGCSNFLLDGEIYVHGTHLQEISGAARKEESGLFASNAWLEYHIYDVIDLDNTKESQIQRNLNLSLISLLKRSTIIHVVSTTEVNNKEEVIALHDKYVSEGYEGLILREQHGEYKFNERSSNLLKVKNYQDEEFEIIDCEAEEGNVGESFVFILRNNINNLTFKSRPTGTIAQKEHWYKNDTLYVGKQATVRFFERSKDGLPQQGSVQHKLTEVLHLRPKGE
jgi:hypothetical protein